MKKRLFGDRKNQKGKCNDAAYTGKHEEGSFRNTPVNTDGVSSQHRHTLEGVQVAPSDRAEEYKNLIKSQFKIGSFQEKGCGSQFKIEPSEFQEGRETEKSRDLISRKAET